VLNAEVGDAPILSALLPVNEPKPRREKRVMSLAGGSLVMVGVTRSSVPVMVMVTSMAPA